MGNTTPKLKAGEISLQDFAQIALFVILIEKLPSPNVKWEAKLKDQRTQLGIKFGNASEVEGYGSTPESALHALAANISGKVLSRVDENLEKIFVPGVIKYIP